MIRLLRGHAQVIWNLVSVLPPNEPVHDRNSHPLANFTVEKFFVLLPNDFHLFEQPKKHIIKCHG